MGILGEDGGLSAHEPVRVCDSLSSLEAVPIRSPAGNPVAPVVLKRADRGPPIGVRLGDLLTAAAALSATKRTRLALEHRAARVGTSPRCRW